MGVEKQIIAIPRIDTKENLNSMSLDPNMKMGAFFKGKDLAKKNKMFLNGYSKYYNQENHFVPLIKAQYVLN